MTPAEAEALVENIDEYLPDLDIWKCHPGHPAREFLNNPKGVVDNSNSSYLKEIENITEWEQICGSYNPQRISMQNSKNRFFFFILSSPFSCEFSH